MTGAYYVDSDVFLYPVLYEDLAEAEEAREILSEIEEGNMEAYTSTLTWDEVSYVVEKVLGRADALTTPLKPACFAKNV